MASRRGRSGESGAAPRRRSPRDAVVAEPGEDGGEGAGPDGPGHDRGEGPARAAGPPAAGGDEDERERVGVADSGGSPRRGGGRRPRTSPRRGGRGRRARPPRPRRAPRGRSAVARATIPHADERLGERLAGAGAVVDEEDPLPGEALDARARRPLIGGRRPSGDDERDPERRAAAPSLEASMPPPIFSASRLQMARPRPVPPNCRVVDGSTWLKLSEEPVEPLLRDADAGVADDDLDPVALPVLPPGRGPEEDLPRLRELHGVREEVQEDLPDAGHVADERAPGPTGRRGRRGRAPCRRPPGRRGRRSPPRRRGGRRGGSPARAARTPSSRSRGRRSGASGACRRSSGSSRRSPAAPA